MANYFLGLAERTLGLRETLQPSIASMFEPGMMLVEDYSEENSEAIEQRALPPSDAEFFFRSSPLKPKSEVGLRQGQQVGGKPLPGFGVNLGSSSLRWGGIVPPKSPTSGGLQAKESESGMTEMGSQFRADLGMDEVGNGKTERFFLGKVQGGLSRSDDGSPDRGLSIDNQSVPSQFSASSSVLVNSAIGAKRTYGTFGQDLSIDNQLVPSQFSASSSVLVNSAIGLGRFGESNWQLHELFGQDLSIGEQLLPSQLSRSGLASLDSAIGLEQFEEPDSQVYREFGESNFQSYRRFGESNPQLHKQFFKSNLQSYRQFKESNLQLRGQFKESNLQSHRRFEESNLQLRGRSGEWNSQLYKQSVPPHTNSHSLQTVQSDRLRGISSEAHLGEAREEENFLVQAQKGSRVKGTEQDARTARSALTPSPSPKIGEGGKSLGSLLPSLEKGSGNEGYFRDAQHETEQAIGELQASSAVQKFNDRNSLLITRRVETQQDLLNSPDPMSPWSESRLEKYKKVPRFVPFRPGLKSGLTGSSFQKTGDPKQSDFQSPLVDFVLLAPTSSPGAGYAIHDTFQTRSDNQQFNRSSVEQDPQANGVYPIVSLEQAFLGNSSDVIAPIPINFEEKQLSDSAIAQINDINHRSQASRIESAQNIGTIANQKVFPSKIHSAIHLLTEDRANTVDQDIVLVREDAPNSNHSQFSSISQDSPEPPQVRFVEDLSIAETQTIKTNQPLHSPASHRIEQSPIKRTDIGTHQAMNSLRNGDQRNIASQVSAQMRSNNLSEIEQYIELDLGKAAQFSTSRSQSVPQISSQEERSPKRMVQSQFDENELVSEQLSEPSPLEVSRDRSISETPQIPNVQLTSTIREEIEEQQRKRTLAPEPVQPPAPRTIAYFRPSLKLGDYLKRRRGDT